MSERRLERYDLVALMLDGKTFAEDEMVVAVGVTMTGEKVRLGFVQTATENRKVCAAFLCALLERGLRVELGLLVVTDGAKVDAVLSNAPKSADGFFVVPKARD